MTSIPTSAPCPLPPLRRSAALWCPLVGTGSSSLQGKRRLSLFRPPLGKKTGLTFLARPTTAAQDLSAPSHPHFGPLSEAAQHRRMPSRRGASLSLVRLGKPRAPTGLLSCQTVPTSVTSSVHPSLTDGKVALVPMAQGSTYSDGQGAALQASLYFLHTWRGPQPSKGFLGTSKRTFPSSALGTGNLSLTSMISRLAGIIMCSSPCPHCTTSSCSVCGLRRARAAVSCLGNPSL